MQNLGIHRNIQLELSEAITTIADVSALPFPRDNMSNDEPMLRHRLLNVVPHNAVHVMACTTNEDCNDKNLVDEDGSLPLNTSARSMLEGTNKMSPSSSIEQESPADLRHASCSSSWLQWLDEPEHMMPESVKNGTKRSTNLDAESIDVKLRCHQNADSFFSTSSGFNNYRGILNLIIILLVLTTGRAALENIIRYGILINPVSWLTVFLYQPYSWPCFYLVLVSNAFVLLAFQIEKALSHRRVTELCGSYLHIANLTTVLTLPAVTILYLHPFPLASSLTLGLYVILFLKLVSYKQVNKWCRTALLRQPLACTGSPSTSKSLPGEMGSHKCASVTSDVFTSTARVTYPHNLNLRNLYYFILAPTFCYELNFPRSPCIRVRFLLTRLTELVFLIGLMLSSLQQWIVPTVDRSMTAVNRMEMSRIVEELLKLAVPVHLVLLMVFYSVCHSLLNIIAELLRFDDRVFYADWWNSESIQYFWKAWNTLAYKWAVRHIYKPVKASGYTDFTATTCVFLLSAFFLEYVISVPLGMFRVWVFIAMLVQIPLTLVSPRYINGKSGNIFVWTSLIVGLPVAVLLYYRDYYVYSHML